MTISGYGLRVASYGLRVAGCRLRVAGCELRGKRAEGKGQKGQKGHRAKGMVHRERHRSMEGAGESKELQVAG